MALTTDSKVTHEATGRSHQLLGRDGEVAVRGPRRRPQLVISEQVLVDKNAQGLAVAEGGHSANREARGVTHGVGVLPPGPLTSRGARQLVLVEQVVAADQ